MDNLEQLKNEAAAVDDDALAQNAPANAQEGTQEAVTHTVDPLVEARGLIGFMCVSACAVLPCLAPVYTPEVQERLAQVTAQLLAQYGISLGGLMGKYGNWLNFAMVVVPIGSQTWQALKAEEARKREAVKPSTEQAPAQPDEQKPDVQPGFV